MLPTYSRELPFFYPLKEFDNYAEWDLKDIDFVDDDSDVLHCEQSFVIIGVFSTELKYIARDIYLFIDTITFVFSFSALKVAVVDIYHSRLKERQRRKK